MNDLRYTPISSPQKEIRLLRFDSDRLSGELTHTLLDRPAHYAALSYSWGIGAPDHQIRFGAENLSITSSLMVALRNIATLRSELLPPQWLKARLLWIDQICIDQHNKVEKAVQIQAMPRIYQSALITLIWLGEADRDAEVAFEYIRRMNAELSRGSDDEFMARQDLARLFDLNSWMAFVRLLERSWFMRRWIVQEATFAQQAVFVCGQMVIGYNDLWRAFLAISEVEGRRSNLLRQQQPAPSGNVDSLIMISHFRKLGDARSVGDGGVSLLKLLEKCRNNRVTEPQDCVFALLGLCGPEERNRNQVTYQASKRDVFQRSVISHLMLHKNLEFLGACNYLASLSQKTDPRNMMELRHPQCPSWTPDWDSQHAIRRLGPSGDISDGNYTGLFEASKGLSMLSVTFREYEQPASLNVAVIPIDRVARIERSYERKDEEDIRSAQFRSGTSDIYRRYFEFWFGYQQVSNPYPTSQAKVNAFVRTLTLGGKWGMGLLQFDNLKIKFQAFFRQATFLQSLFNMGFGAGSQDTEPQRSLPVGELKYFKAVSTQKGHMALTRFGCWEGDWICVVAGCSTPLLLRGPIGRSNHYILRGEVYIDGFMRGEAVTASQKGQLQVQHWVIV